MIQVASADGSARPVRVAAVLDPRDVPGIAAEATLTVLDAYDWHDQVSAASPDVVVVQSAEVRPDGLPVVPLGGHTLALAQWCRRHAVPSVFWSTLEGARGLEDLWLASHFDHVATADLDAVLDWRGALGHDRVHLATPGVAPPAPASDERSPHATLAAAFDPSAPHPGLLDLLGAAVATVPVLVHDLADADGVPPGLAALVAPTPDLEQTDATARVGLALPVATQSPTLLDRRTLAQLAAGLPVVSTHAHAATLLFGDVVTATDDPARLRAAIADAVTEDTRRELADRVLASHGWEPALHRLLEPVLPLVPLPASAHEGPVADRLDAALAAATTSPRPGAPAAAVTPLAPLLGGLDDPTVDVVDDHGDLVVTSGADGPVDVWSQGTVTPRPLVRPGWTTIWFEAEPRGLVGLRLEFLDADGAVLRDVTAHGSVRTPVSVPRRTTQVRAGLRLHGPGTARVGGLRLGGAPRSGPAIATGDHLLVTNRYPSYDAPYNNMFVHKRVQGYAEHGAPTDVLRVVEQAPRTVHEFEGIECTTGGAAVLDAMLASGDHTSIAAHFMTPPVWEMLQPHLDDRRLCVWIHGFEVQPWWRRAFSYESAEELAHAKEASASRMAMWQEVLADPRPHFVFVSRFLADQAMEDTGITLPPDQFSIIHNPIDTDLFAHHEKGPEQRFQLLSIRPFASNIYANDLTAAAILDLVDEPWFDRLRIRMIGEGRLFEEVTAPLRDLKNVRLEPRFLQQAEIARLHREHGVFLCPSRLDSHGVSRDEAMASGLVPVTSAVAAIPEFVDEESGFLAPPDDHRAVADAIRALVEDPDLFLRMSAAAAARVRRQADHRIVLDQELAVLRGR